MLCILLVGVVCRHVTFYDVRKQWGCPRLRGTIYSGRIPLVVSFYTVHTWQTR